MTAISGINRQVPYTELSRNADPENSVSESGSSIPRVVQIVSDKKPSILSACCQRINDYCCSCISTFCCSPEYSIHRAVCTVVSAWAALGVGSLVFGIISKDRKAIVVGSTILALPLTVPIAQATYFLCARWVDGRREEA